MNSPLHPVPGMVTGRHLMDSPSLRSAQRRHLLIVGILPLLLALSSPLWIPDDWADLRWFMLCAFMWWVTGCLGISVGYHRLFAHHAFTAQKGLRYALGILGGMAGQGSVTYWVALHRHHHTCSDQEGDVHSPQPVAQPGRSWLGAFWQGHMGWVGSHKVPKPNRFALDLLRDPVAQGLSKHYPLWMCFGLVLPGALGYFMKPTVDGVLLGVFWGGVVRLVLGNHIIWMVNSVCHTGGSRPHANGDRSGNVWWLSLPTWGESWHNNHHAYPTSARLGLSRLQIDVGWWCIRFFEQIGLATKVRLPNV